MLGGIEVIADGTRRPLGGPSSRLLLAALAVRRRRVVSLDALAEALWGDDPPPTARATLQTHLSKLRRALAGGELALEHRPPGYVLDVAAELVDADGFEAELAAAGGVAAVDPQQALERSSAALDRWRGPAFAEFADEPWARPEAVRLEELRLVAHEVRIDALLALGAHGLALGDLEALVDEHPLRECFRMQHLVALHRSGRQAEALRSAAELRRRLGDDVGLAPSAAFVALERAVAADDPSMPAHPGRAAGGVPVAASLGATVARAPAPTAALVGRASDLERLEVEVRSARLLTLTGTGGVGKSSMATELAGRLATAFRDGVRVVELAPAQDEAAVVPAVARALDAERRAGRTLAEAVTEVLGTQELLLVLDNCEHVVGAVGELLRQIVRWCPEVRVLATSREPIGVSGEVVWSVAPLDVPPDPSAPLAEVAGASAVQVFAARAAAASPGFVLDGSSAPAVAEICIQLDGLPLALELAAARLASMSAEQLVDRLHHRFALLDGGGGREGRHRTLADLVDWSYELLSERERLLLGRLSVFAGGFDLDAAEATCGVGGLDPGSVAPVLAALVDKSMVVADHHDGEVRYRQLETLRQYGAARLAEQPAADAVRRAHVATYVALVEAGATGLEGPDEAAWSARLDVEVGNLRVAVRSAIDTGDADGALRLVVAARELAFRRMHYELVDWAEAASRLPGAPSHPLQPTVLGIVGYGAFVRGELAGAVALAEQAVAVREALDVPPCGLPERVLANALFYLGEHEVALAWMDRMVDAARASGVDGRLAHALYMRSVARTSIGDADGGLAVADEVERAATRSGSPTALAHAAYARGLAMVVEDHDGALALFDRAAALAASVGNRWLWAFALTEAMWLRAGRGEVAAALAGEREVVEAWFRGGDWANQWLSLRQLAGILARLGRDDEAALLFGAVAAAGASSALPLSPLDADELGYEAAALAARLGPAAMAEATRRGAMLRADAAVGTALRAIDALAAPG